MLISFGLPWWGGETVNFDSSKPGTVPSGWTVAVTHKGAPARWIVHPDVTAPSGPNVLAQLSNDKTRFRFPLAIYDKVVCRDGDVTVKFKLVGGKIDQTVGLVWRYQDPNNYYLVHASGNANNVAVFKLHDGKSTAIAPVGADERAPFVPHEVEERHWNTLRVFFRGARASVYLNHRKLLEAQDSTFLQAGRTGVWTKSDTIAYFDDFRIDKK